MARINYDAINELKEYNELCVEDRIDTRESYRQYTSTVFCVSEVKGLGVVDFFDFELNCMDTCLSNYAPNGTLTYSF